MALLLSCPRCAREVGVSAAPEVDCPTHGLVTPLTRPHRLDLDGLREVSELVPELSVFVPWPMSPNWSIADLGCVAGGQSATFSVVRGSTIPDGDVEITIVSEEPGVGLGARCAELAGVDPGHQFDVGSERPSAYVRIDSRAVPLWIIKTLDPEADPFALTAFAGEADGRWLWVIVRPASAALLMRDDWLLADIAGISEDALGMPFGEVRASWI